MPAIHFVERLQNLTFLDNGECESGYWVIGAETAEKLIGGLLYLHSGQLAPSHFGGRIQSTRVEEQGAHAGRVVFRFQPDVSCKGVRTSREGWGNEKKIVW